MGLTRSGWSLLAVAAVTLVVARTLQVPQMWMIGASLVLAVAAAWCAVMRRLDHCTVTRTVAPGELQVGTPAQVLVDVTAHPQRRSPSATVVCGTQSWRLASLPPGARSHVAWTLNTAQRGVVTLPGLQLRRSDIMGLAQRTLHTCDAVDVVVSPRTVPLAMAQMGVGALGSQLTHRARHFGVGEFEGLRHYVEGDDLRLVHWKASARSTDLLVKQFSLEGARRCTVVVDTSTSCPGPQFEIGVSIAASLVEAAHTVDLAVRLVTTGGLNLSGGASSASMRRALASVGQGSPMTLPVRDPADGVGLLLCITPTIDSEVWRRRDHYADPAMVTMAVSLSGEHGLQVIDGSSLEVFAQSWHRLVSTHADSRGGT